MFDIIMGALAIMGVLAGLLAISIIYFTREDKPNTKNKARPGIMRQRIYAHIKRNRYCTQKEIAEELGTVTSNVSVHVQNLVDLGRIDKPAHKGGKWIIYK